MQYKPETHKLQYACVNGSSDAANLSAFLLWCASPTTPKAFEQLGICKIPRYGMKIATHVSRQLVLLVHEGLYFWPL